MMLIAQTMVSLSLGELALLASPLVAFIVWLIRLEGRHNAAEKGLADQKALVAEHYATREELAIVTGQISTLTPQINDMKAGVLRIEGKVDAFLIAAVEKRKAP